MSTISPRVDILPFQNIASVSNNLISEQAISILKIVGIAALILLVCLAIGYLIYWIINRNSSTDNSNQKEETNLSDSICLVKEDSNDDVDCIDSLIGTIENPHLPIDEQIRGSWGVEVLTRVILHLDNSRLGCIIYNPHNPPQEHLNLHGKRIKYGITIIADDQPDLTQIKNKLFQALVKDTTLVVLNSIDPSLKSVRDLVIDIEKDPIQEKPL